VALPTLNRNNFRDAANGVIAAASGLLDWCALLQCYEWNGAGWRIGLEARSAMHGQLAEAAGKDELADAAAEIVSWGGLPPLSTQGVARVLGSLPLLDELAMTNAAPPATLYADRIPAVSKVYAMHDLSRWVIYDSRVARGLALLVRQAYGPRCLPPALVFPQPQGRTGLCPEGFPVLGTEKQARLGFVYASWFAQDVAAQIDLACPDPSGWDARHVEMALFMLGSPSGRIAQIGTTADADQIVAAIDGRLRELRDEIAKLDRARAALVRRWP
jgi:hypothetical protein